MTTTFDPDKYYLGSLCKRGHDWEGTGKSFRRRSDNRCPQCQYEYNRVYRIDNINQIRDMKRTYYAKNREKIAELHRRQYQKDHEKRRETARKKYWANPEKFREQARSSRQRNREKINKARRIKYQANPQEFRAKARIYYQRNSAKILEINRKSLLANPQRQAKKLKLQLDWCRNNPKKRAISRKKWKKNNPEKVREQRLGQRISLSNCYVSELLSAVGFSNPTSEMIESYRLKLKLHRLIKTTEKEIKDGRI